MIYIGLYGDHQLSDAAVIPTTITADESIARPMGDVLAFSYPGMYENDYERHNDVTEMTILQPNVTSSSTTSTGYSESGAIWLPEVAFGCPEGWNYTNERDYALGDGAVGHVVYTETCLTPEEQGVPITPLVQDGTVQSSPGANGEPAVVEIPKEEALPPSCPKNASGVPMC